MPVPDDVATALGDSTANLYETLLNYLTDLSPPSVGISDFPTESGMDIAELTRVETLITDEVLPRLRAAIAGKTYTEVIDYGRSALP
ncbi:MAG TPA: hypothetical protein VGA20_04400 [Gemmatimonadales bacterium]